MASRERESVDSEEAQEQQQHCPRFARCPDKMKRQAFFFDEKMKRTVFTSRTDLLYSAIDFFIGTYVIVKSSQHFRVPEPRADGGGRGSGGRGGAVGGAGDPVLPGGPASARARNRPHLQSPAAALPARNICLHYHRNLGLFLSHLQEARVPRAASGALL